MDDKTENLDGFFMGAFIDDWDERIKALACIDRVYPNGTAMLLCCCYIEAIGKFLLYDDYKINDTLKALGERNHYEIYVEILQNYSNSIQKQIYSQDDVAKRIYKEFRCDIVHAGPTNRCLTIGEKTIDFEFLKETLKSIFSAFKARYEDKEIEEIAKVYDFFDNNVLDFQEILENDHLLLKDNRADYGEQRFIAIGTLRQRIAVVVYTKRAHDIYRIISMRKANEREKKTYSNKLKSLRQLER